jgi:uncharacterized protein (DUF983 family)
MVFEAPPAGEERIASFPMPTRLAAILKLRCPCCLQGRVFAGTWRMHTTCPVCAIRFERETGYFLTAVFFGYVLGFLAVLPMCIAFYLAGASATWFLAGIIATIALLSPLLFRYSRILWMHADELMDPRPQSEPANAE